jgi:transcriptional regulator with GAF, ATPase, and Fis domain
MDKPDRSDDRQSLLARGEEFLQVFKKGAEFTQELLRENERLRYKIVQLEEKARGLEETGSNVPDKKLIEQIRQLEKERRQLLDKYKEVEAENKDFASRYLEIEEENNNLANLYVASYQLHSTLDFKEVLQIILEIVINLIGAEEFGVLLLDEKTNELKAVATEGIPKENIPSVKLGVGRIGTVAKVGDNYFTDDISEYSATNPLEPMVCIPLKIKEHVIGVIVIYKLLQQKKKFSELDHELFTLLAGHAATATFASKLYSESERKLSTIQGFIELLTK